MKTIIKTAIVLVVMLLSVFCYGQDKATNYVENEFIIWLEQGVDASTFAANSDDGIAWSDLGRIPMFALSKTTIPTSRCVKLFLTIPTLTNNGLPPL